MFGSEKSYVHEAKANPYGSKSRKLYYGKLNWTTIELYSVLWWTTDVAH